MLTSRLERPRRAEALCVPKVLGALSRSAEEVRELADKSYQLLKSNPHHPSLHFKGIGELWSVRVGEHYRALGTDEAGGINWIWIGTHAEYDELVT